MLYAKFRVLLIDESISNHIQKAIIINTDYCITDHLGFAPNLYDQYHLFIS